MKDTLKFQFTDSKFYTNEEKRTVVCCLTGILRGLEDENEDLLKKYGGGYYSEVAWDSDLGCSKYEVTVSAKAKADPADEWNETLGKQIAESRAKAKVYAMLYNILSAKQKEILQELAAVDTLAEKYLNLCSIEAGHLNKLIEE